MTHNPFAQSIARQIRQLHTGGNWTAVCLKDVLQDVSLADATPKTESLNTIAVLAYHTHYYVTIQIAVLKGGPLSGNDKDSFTPPPLNDGADWEALKTNIFEAAETLAGLVENLSDEQLLQPFTNDQYGSYYRNLTGMVEHTHYHLGQMQLLKKLMAD